MPTPPRADEWVLWSPPLGDKPGQAVLSPKGSLFILATLAVAQERKDLRAKEHKCLDAHEAKGLIQQ